MSVGPGNCPEVDDARLRAVKTRDSTRMRLELANAVRIDATQALDAVCRPLRASSSNLGRSAGVVATISFPHLSCGIPRSSQ